MNKEVKQINTFPFWRLLIGTLIGGTFLYGSLIFGFMQRGLNTPFTLFLYCYIGTFLMCVLPMFIAYIRNINKKNTVYWLSFLGVTIPLGTICWIIGLIMAVFAKSTQKMKHSKKALIAYISGFCTVIVLLVVCGINIHNIYDSSFIIPKWEDRFALNEKESGCYFAAKFHKSRYKQDEVYRDCLNSLKESEKRKHQEEVEKIKKMSLQQKYDAVLQSCVNALHKTPNIKYINKYDKQKKANEIKKTEQLNNLSKSLCKCSTDLFIKEAEEKEIIDVLATKPFDTQHYFFTRIDLPFNICLEERFPSFIDRANIKQEFKIGLLYNYKAK